jgi:hypothetical protein
MPRAVASDKRIFCSRISKLLKTLDDGLLLRVMQCADAAPEIKRLCLKREGTQHKFNALVGLKQFIVQQALDAQRALSAEESKKVYRLKEQILACSDKIKALRDRISKAYKPFISTSADVRRFVATVQESFDYIPANSRRLQNIRTETKRLQLFDLVVATPASLPMKLVHSQLLALRQRLSEFLEQSVELRSDLRRKIVNTLQKTLDCRGREQLAKLLCISDSAIRAAIRGDHSHSGQSAEKKILEACHKYRVDAALWQ